MPFMCAYTGHSGGGAGAGTPIPSAGPYYISNYTPGSRLILTRNPNYEGPRPSNLDQILYQLNVGLATSLAQIESGTADFSPGEIPAESFAQFAHDFPTQLFVNPSASLRYIALNTSRSLFSTVARQAVNLVVNRTAILATGGAFSGTPTDQYIPATVPGFRDESIYPLDGPSSGGPGAGERTRRPGRNPRAHSRALYERSRARARRGRPDSRRSRAHRNRRRHPRVFARTSRSRGRARAESRSI